MQLMTIKEAQEYLKKSKSAFYRDIKNGDIPIVRIGSKPLVVKDKLDAEIKRQLSNG
jgi:excisionase family DNA binding protein